MENILKKKHLQIPCFSTVTENLKYHIRLTLFDKLRQIPSSVCLQTLLFGDDFQSLSDNKRVVQAFHSFIIASKRFP